MRPFAITAVLLLVCAAPSAAIIISLLNDDHDDTAMINGVSERKEVVEYRERLNELTKQLYRFKERDIEALFGKAQSGPLKNHAMPVAQPRAVALSGLRSRDPKLNKNHTELYLIKDVAALQVYYQTDGTSLAAVVYYFPVDAGFPKLTEDNFAQRLAWDTDHLSKLLAYFEKRMREVFPFEIDREAQSKFTQGDFAADARVKLEAWMKSGQALGYRYAHTEGGTQWNWYRPDGTLARAASSGKAGALPVDFFWYHSDGRTELRKETFGFDTGALESRRWCRSGSNVNIRCETANAWCWCGQDGKTVRQEWDDNGDGIPDWYVTQEDQFDHVFDTKAMAKRRPLLMTQSWAIVPQWIPEECRISDQPELRLPVRRKSDREPVTK